MCHVLIIEDEYLVAYDLTDTVMDAGATSAEIAMSPSQALAQALAHPPAIILSDVQIVGGTGPEAVAAIRQRLGPIPVIFITGSPDACEQIAAEAVLTKPVFKHRLIEVFQAAMASSGSLSV